MLRTDNKNERGLKKTEKKRGYLDVMLAEGFLRVLRYREERKFASRGHKMQTHTLSRDPLFTAGVLSNSTSLQADSTEAGKPPHYLDSA